MCGQRQYNTLLLPLTRMMYPELKSHLTQVCGDAQFILLLCDGIHGHCNLIKHESVFTSFIIIRATCYALQKHNE
jgi:hypothetical protein